MTEVTMSTETPPAPAPPASAEFPLSTLCLKVRVGDVEMSWTLRGDDSDVARRLPRALATIKKLQDDGKLLQGTKPEPLDRRPALAPGSTRGQAQAPLEERADWCSIHQVAMSQQANERGSWWSHRLADGTGYCKGKRRKAGA